MEEILNIYHDCDTFSLSLSGAITQVTADAKDTLVNSLKNEEKERLREYYDKYKAEGAFSELPEYDDLFEEIFEETKAFYAEFEGKDFTKLVGMKDSPFICDHVGKDTKYSQPLNMIWHLYHNCQMILMNSDSLAGLPVNDTFAYKVFENEFNKPLKDNLLRYEYTYSSHCTVGPLQLVYYFKLNDQTKNWLNNFETDYDLEKSDFEDLAIYKNGKLEFSSCTHEGFNSLDSVWGV